MKSLILLSLISFSIFAHEDCRQLNLAEQLLSFLPARECPSDEAMILKRAEDEYQKFYGQLPKVKKKIKGVNLVGSQKEIDLANEMLGKKPPSTWKAAAEGCDTVICAFTKLYEGSRESALQLFNIKAKSNYHLSLDQSINQGLAEQIWSPGEVREIDAAISKLPPELSRLNLKGIDRVADTLRLHGHGPMTGAYASPKPFFGDAELVVYDTGMKGLTNGSDPALGVTWPQEVIVHELCHHHDFIEFKKTGSMTSEKHKSEFAALSGWKEKTNIKGESEWVKTNDQFVSWYSETAPAEDYAESCMSYLLHPEDLKQKAPEKYAYMKKNLFNDKEFLDKPWTNGIAADWPALAEKLEDQSMCSAKIAECAQTQKFYSYSSIESQLQQNECFKKFKNDKLASINNELGDDPQYCERGGSTTVSKAAERFCSSTIKGISLAVDNMKNKDFSLAIKTCEKKNDFSESCIIDSSISDVNLAPEMLSLLPRMMDAKIPDRMTALGNHSENLPSSGWINSCIKLAKNIDILTGTSGGKETTFVSYHDGKGKSTYLGKYIYKDYNHNDLNKECAQSALKEFEKVGVKTPLSGSPTNLMQKPFLDELESFHTEVLAKVKDSQKGCLLSASCKDDRVLELLQRWEVKNASKRSGIASEEFARELRAKVK